MKLENRNISEREALCMLNIPLGALREDIMARWYGLPHKPRVVPGTHAMFYRSEIESFRKILEGARNHEPPKA